MDRTLNIEQLKGSAQHNEYVTIWKDLFGVDCVCIQMERWRDDEKK